MKKISLSQLTRLAVITALSIVLGISVQLKTPTGFVTLLDAGIFFTAFYLGGKEAAIVGGLSGFLIDLLLGYPQWMVVSLVAHGLQGYLAGFEGKKRPLGLLLASLVMVGIYFVASIGFYNLGEALVGLPSNLMQNLIGLMIGFVLASFVKKRGRI